MIKPRAALGWLSVVVLATMALSGAARVSLPQDEQVGDGLSASSVDGQYLLDVLDHDRERPDYNRAIGAPQLEAN